MDLVWEWNGRLALGLQCIHLWNGEWCSPTQTPGHAECQLFYCQEGAGEVWGNSLEPAPTVQQPPIQADSEAPLSTFTVE